MSASAKVGKCNTSKPGMLDFTGKAKWYVCNASFLSSIAYPPMDERNAWNELGDKSKEDAEAEYVQKLKDVCTPLPLSAILGVPDP